MIYLDYSATTPVNDEVLKSFCDTTKTYIGNPNSLHQLGVKSKHLMDLATEQIAKLLHIKSSEVIYTSGATEANNLALIGTALKYQNRGKHIITTNLEHSSILAPCQYLKTLGFEIDTVPLLPNGQIDMDALKKMVRTDTILVSIASVSSELGIQQPIEEIGSYLKQFPKCFFHVDMTQSIGKVEIPLSNIDMASFSAHKFYGLKGIGCLIKKEKIEIDPMIRGGKSTTVYRSGTPALPLIVSLSKALRLALENLDEKQRNVQALEQMLMEGLSKIDGVVLNHPDTCIPHIVNISVIGVKPETMLHALEMHDIYISTQTACATQNGISLAVYEMTKQKENAMTSMRISLSHLTTKEEVQIFLNVLKTEYDHFTSKK